MILGIGVTGIWQFSSKSVYSMSSVRSAMLMIKENTGHLAGIPFYMRVEMQKSAIAGNPHVFPVVSVDCAMDLEELMAHNIKQITAPVKQIEEKKLDSSKEITPEPGKKEATGKPKKVFKNVFVQKKWDEFDKWIEENKTKLDTDMYDTSRKWLDKLERTDTRQLTINLDKLKNQIKNESQSSESKYKAYHDDLITECAKLLATKDRLPVIQTLDNMVKAWKIEGSEQLSDVSENECLNLLEEFEKQQKTEQDDDLPY